MSALSALAFATVRSSLPASVVALLRHICVICSDLARVFRLQAHKVYPKDFAWQAPSLQQHSYQPHSGLGDGRDPALSASVASASGSAAAVAVSNDARADAATEASKAAAVPRYWIDLMAGTDTLRKGAPSCWSRRPPVAARACLPCFAATAVYVFGVFAGVSVLLFCLVGFMANLSLMRFACLLPLRLRCEHRHRCGPQRRPDHRGLAERPAGTCTPASLIMSLPVAASIGVVCVECSSGVLCASCLRDRASCAAACAVCVRLSASSHISADRNVVGASLI